MLGASGLQPGQHERTKEIGQASSTQKPVQNKGSNTKHSKTKPTHKAQHKTKQCNAFNAFSKLSTLTEEKTLPQIEAFSLGSRPHIYGHNALTRPRYAGRLAAQGSSDSRSRKFSTMASTSKGELPRVSLGPPM